MSTYDPDNIFAKIMRGEIPCHKVHEDDETLVFMDIMPKAPGHALVIPKAPCRNLMDAPENALNACIATTQTIAQAAMKAFEADGVTIHQNNEAAGGQEVFHLHFHVIPRQDGVRLKPQTGEMEDNDVLAANCEKLKAAL